MKTQDIRKVLYQIEELAGESQQLWDNAWTNAVVADHPDKAGYTQQTYKATRIHSDCMDILRALLNQLQEDALQQDPNYVDPKTFAAMVKLGLVRFDK
jgi:hypothetical protein